MFIVSFPLRCRPYELKIPKCINPIHGKTDASHRGIAVPNTLFHSALTEIHIKLGSDLTLDNQAQGIGTTRKPSSMCLTIWVYTSSKLSYLRLVEVL